MKGLEYALVLLPRNAGTVILDLQRGAFDPHDDFVTAVAEVVADFGKGVLGAGVIAALEPIAETIEGDATFAAAVKDNPSGTNTAANRIGQEIAQVADRTLSDNSRLNIALKNLNTQAGNLESRQTAQQAMADAAQASAEQAGLRLNSALTASGIASYQKIFSL